MNHLTDELLNEYLDNELANRAPVEQHLSTCADCAARLAVLQALFAELDSLPEETLPHNIASRLTLPSNLPAVLPRSLRLAVTLQAAIAVIAIIIAAPFVKGLVSPYLVSVQMPSFTQIFFQAQSQWTAWLDELSTFHIPTMPQLPSLEMSSLMLMITLTGVSILWLAGNGLLLRKQIK
jgi:anti-sigma factor RsiW